MTPTAQDVAQKYLDSDPVYKQFLHVLQQNGLLRITQEKEPLQVHFTYVELLPLKKTRP
jgi:hypothetical protein